MDACDSTFLESPPLRKSYVVASSYRCGSTYFCSRLWSTGVLGAPAEYLNVGVGRMLRHVMESRLQATSPEDYFAKLLACRTSSNGVFGMKAHYHHFEEALDLVSVDDRAIVAGDLHRTSVAATRLAQAVSMAKAMQTNSVDAQWTPRSKPTLRYDAVLDPLNALRKSNDKRSAGCAGSN